MISRPVLRHYLLIVLGGLFLCTSTITGQTTLLQETFETDGNGTRYTTSIAEFSDGSGDFFTRTDGSNIGSFYNVSGQMGSFYFAAMDIDGEGANIPVSLTISNIDISGFSNLSFSGLFAEDDDGSNEDWDLLDYVHIFYSIDGGAEQNLLWFESVPDGDSFNAVPAEDTNFDGDGDGTNLTATFQEFTKAIAGTGSSLTIRIEFFLDSGDEDISIDEILVTGEAASTEPQPGDIVITEIMQNPDAVGDSNGEWFEVYNSTSSDIDLNGWWIEDNGSDFHVINTSVIVSAGGYAVLGNNANMATNGGVMVDYSYGSGWFLANGDDEVVIVAPNETEIDRVEYDGGPNFPDPEGASMSLNPDNLNATDNDDGSNWCVSTSVYGDGDLGTPGAANDACPSSECSITSVMIDGPECDGDDSFFGISFNVMNGSGEYTFITPGASLFGSALGTGITDGMVSGSGQANIEGEGVTVQVIVVDAINETCRSTPVNMFVPVCPDPCPSGEEVFINEFHYDDVSTDDNEFVEVAVANSYEGDLSTLTVSLYNGSSSQLNVYGSATLDNFAVGADDGTYTYYSMMIAGFNVSGIQNGSPDGFSLDCNGQVLEFLSYEGTFTAGSGPAMGMASMDVGVSEPGDTPEGSSIELFDGVWINVCENTKGDQNQGITECCDIEILSVNTTTACPDEGGTITINASCTSCDGIQYSIDGGATFQTSNTFTDQPIASYQVVVQDQADSECEDMTTVMVSGPDGSVPAPWMTSDVGSSGAAGNAYAFDECEEEFTVSGGGNNAFPGTNTDAVAFINQTLCGDAEIVAKIESVTPNGYGGLMMRETNSSTARQVSIFSNLTNPLRHEARYTTGGNKVVQSHYRPNPFWLKLVRQGNWFFAYYSATGTNFQYVHAVNVPMGTCIQVGLASFTYLPGQQCTAVFSNVSVSGGFSGTAVDGPVEGVAFETEKLGASTLYPNPATNMVNIELGTTREQSTTLRLRNELGQVVEQRRLEVPAVKATLDVSGLNNGMYFIEVITEGQEREVLRFIKAQ